MKTLSVLCLLLFSIAATAQTSVKALTVIDSSCITECRGKAQAFSKNKNATRYQLDKEFFCHLSPYNAQTSAAKLQIVNLGDDKILSITIQQMQVTGTNLKGEHGILTADEPVDLMKDAAFPRCKMLNLDLGKGNFPHVHLHEIESIRIKITYEGKEKIYVIGKEK
ncbi:hypothetical protein HHL16_10200 [Pseudoflavitalea sp. G-6-1-2]|uniref:hypothetical protein n=1 Tax=Pseudoflavitalea sp. G-6-1-2 TaxID=2728841 RepID=UPI00146D40F6|nr:hypothetical protein [Pseudoflavitalea sp. G-6-1-2]NML21245.1 hypothetical protein [Pseudoflavitalea sp. G-6-1-2]